MGKSNKIERSEVWHNIYEVLARLDLKEVEGDCLDRPSAATEIEQAVKKLLPIQNVSISLPSDPMVLAKYLHDNYEQIAKRTNWETQKNCKVAFEDLPTENKNTMILLAGKLIMEFVGNER